MQYVSIEKSKITLLVDATVEALLSAAEINTDQPRSTNRTVKTQVTVTDVGGAAKRSGDIFTGGVTAPTITLNDASQPTGSQAVKYSNAPWLGTNSIIRTNANNIAENITVDSATNGMSAGPIQIDSGFTVTVNGEWSIV